MTKQFKPQHLRTDTIHDSHKCNLQKNTHRAVNISQVHVKKKSGYFPDSWLGWRVYISSNNSSSRLTWNIEPANNRTVQNMKHTTSNHHKIILLQPFKAWSIQPTPFKTWSIQPATIQYIAQLVEFMADFLRNLWNTINTFLSLLIKIVIQYIKKIKCIQYQQGQSLVGKNWNSNYEE